MKKSKKLMLLIPVLLLVVVVFAGNVFATTTSSGISTSIPQGGEGIESVNNAVSNVWGTVLLIFQILAIAAIVFAGIRYMFASADQKADIKKSMIILVVGAVLVFGASTVAQVIVKATQEISGIEQE